MARPTSAVNICSLALDILKQGAIQDIAVPQTTTEKICARWYDMTRQECLAAHPWKFAIKRDILTPDGTAPVFGYTYAYNLPNDYIRMVSIGDDFLGDLSRQREVENGQILLDAGTDTDGTSVQIRYVYDITSVTQFAPLFIKYFVLQLALNMCNKFSISATARQQILSEFNMVQAEAKAVNGQENKIKRIQNSRILTKRRGMPGGVFASPYTIFDQ